MTIEFIIGDATQPRGDGTKILVHVCNDVGAWGKGFVVALSRRFKQPEQEFKRWAAGETGGPYALGEVQFVQVSAELTVANLIGQHGITRRSKPTALPPVRYDAIRAGLHKVRTEALARRASLHMPRIGTGLAGGDWSVVQQIIEEELAGLAVTVYDLPTDLGS